MAAGQRSPMSTAVLGSVAEATEQAIARLDVDRLSRDYWEQNEFIVIPQFLPRDFVEATLVPQAQGVKHQLNRNYIPGHKKGGSVSYYAVQEQTRSFLICIAHRHFWRFSAGSPTPSSCSVRTMIRTRAPCTITRRPVTISGFTTTPAITKGPAIQF